MKNIKNALILSVCSLALIGIVTVQQDGDKSIQQKQKLEEGALPAGGISESEKAEKAVAAEPDPGLSGVEKSVQLILGAADSALFDGYPVDNSFLFWLAKSEGEAVLNDVAYACSQGTANRSLWSSLTGNSMSVLYADYRREIGLGTRFEKQLTVQNKDENNGQDIVLSLVGDINFDETWGTMQLLHQNGDVLNTVIDPALIQILNESTIACINNEFPYTTGGTPVEGKDYTFRANPDTVRYIEELGGDIVSLGNNHVYDYGAEGLLSTIKTLDEHKISYTGAGQNLEDAMSPRYFEANGKIIAVVAATQVEILLDHTKEAAEDAPGVLKTQDASKFVKVIREAAANSDYVVVDVHWGWEGRLYMDAEQNALAEKFADAGADVIVGGHSHRLQGVSYVKGVPVIHSLGNFWFSDSELYTTILQVVIGSDGGLKVRMVPCVQSGGKTFLLTEPARVVDFYRYVADLSSDTGITADGIVGYCTGDNSGDFEYLSGVHYRSHSPGFDLYGNPIDMIGNLKQAD